MSEPDTGPRLSDHEFFTTLLDESQSGLAKAVAAASSGDLDAARTLFATEVRANLRPDLFFRQKRSFTEAGAHLIHPAETAAEVAERVIGGELVSCGTPMRFSGEIDWYANPTHNQYSEWTWQLNRHPEWGVLAERYRETSDERYAHAFVRQFRGWVRQAVAPDWRGPFVPGNHTKAWRTIELGIRMGGSWPWVLHSFFRSPAFTDADLVDFYKSVWEHGWRLRHCHRTHNWLIMEMNGLAQIGLLFPQLRDAPAWQEYALDRLVEELPAQVHPDGMQYELSTGYHQVNIRNYQWVWDLYAAYDQSVPPEFGQWLELMQDANLRLARPVGRLPNLNDGREHDIAKLMTSAAERFPHRPEFAWAATGGRAGEMPDYTSVAFPYAGYYVMRTGWEPTAIWALVDAGPFGVAHQHEDKLNLLLDAYGRTLLTEGGNYAYDDSPMRRYVLSTRSHNTIRVDDADQNRGVHFRRDDVDVRAHCGASWHTSADRDVVAARYNEGYGAAADIAVTHHRSVTLYKAGLDTELSPFLLVVDRLVPPDEETHSYEALWHFDPEHVTSAGSMVRSDDADLANLTIVAGGPADLTTHVVSGQEEPLWQGWKTTGDGMQGEYTPAPTAVYSWRGSGPTRLVTVVYPRPAGAECPIETVEAADDPADTTVRLRLSDARTIELSESHVA